MDLTEIGFKIGLMFVPFLFALCFHEYAHGLVAKWKGDTTAERLGRLTMNPMAHADMLGTFFLPLAAIIFGSPIFFGWAKPVPVDTRNLRNIRTDMFWIALAGPLSNVLLAVMAAFIMYLGMQFNFFGSYVSYVFLFLQVFIRTNLFLAVFNILPIHPLDGGKVLARFLPASINHKLEQNEQISSIILMMLVFTGMLSVLAIPVIYLFKLLVSLSGAPLM